MFWLIWKQQRKSFLWGILLVVVFAVLALATAHAVRQPQAGYVSTMSLDLIRAGMAIPLLLGMFWGAPLLSSEYENGTNKFVWTQGVSRRKWLFAKLSSVMLVAAVCGLVCAVMASWWFGLHASGGVVARRFDTAQFGSTGLMPVVYSIFAVALGSAVGAWLRKPVVALGTVLVMYVVLQGLVVGYLRPHYMQPLRYTYKPLTGCHTTYYPDGGYGTTCTGSDLGPTSLDNSWIVGMRSRTVMYQPAYRYWDFQRIEAGIFVGLTAATVAAAYGLVLRRDA